MPRIARIGTEGLAMPRIARMATERFAARRIASRVIAAVLGVLLAGLGQAGPPSSSHPGFVSAEPFLSLATRTDEVTEINLGPELLRALAKGFEDDPEASRLLSGIVAVHAVVIGIKPEPPAARLDAARKLVGDTTERLLRTGWETLVRVREADSTVSVLTRAAGVEGKVQGLAVLVVDLRGDEGGGPEIVFANIAGTVDLAQISRLSGGLDLPGLDRIDRDAD